MVRGQPQKATDTGLPEPRRARAVVAFLDIVGFSALMGIDETATFQRWKELKETYVLPLLVEHQGRFVKATGDGLIAIFPAGDAAVHWATEVQRGARARGEGLRMRIALNFGDVIVDEDGDIAGDCVNIAARLEELALPGGVIITKEFRDALAQPDEVDLDPVGQLKLRNIRRHVTAYHVQTDARGFVPTATVDQTRRLPSIAVLPFQSDEAERFFCNGIVDDVIASLSGVQELNVIALSTAKALSGSQRIDPRNLGLALGVDYIVTGALQRNPGRMRLSYQLVDAEDGQVISSDRVAFDVEDLFAAQDQLVEKIVAGVAPQIRRVTLEHALRRPPASFSAYEHLLRAIDKVASLDRDEFEDARTHLDAAIAEDPDFANPLAWSARWRTLRVGQGWSPDPDADIAAAAAEAQRAISLDRRNALALATFGHVRAYTAGDYETAIDYLDRAVAAGPNNAIAHILRSGTLSFLGRADEARAEAEKALRLSPFDEQLFQFYGFLALACYVGDRFDEAIRWARRSVAENPNYTHTLKVLAVAQVGAGDLAAAQATVSQLLQREPGFRTGRYRSGRTPFQDPSRVELLIERFEAAGVPA
jgi:adenylate cyclase